MLDLGCLLAESGCLTDFDISWNILKSKSYITLIDALAENRVLKNLNLSWNQLVEAEKIQAVVTARD